jgi:hypothetical protein
VHQRAQVDVVYLEPMGRRPVHEGRVRRTGPISRTPKRSYRRTLLAKHLARYAAPRLRRTEECATYGIEYTKLRVMNYIRWDRVEP